MMIECQCSNCGKTFKATLAADLVARLYLNGYRAVGDAFYCDYCVKTWDDRNGVPYDKQYGGMKRTLGMLGDWLVNQQQRNNIALENVESVVLNCALTDKEREEIRNWRPAFTPWKG